MFGRFKSDLLRTNLHGRSLLSPSMIHWQQSLDLWAELCKSNDLIWTMPIYIYSKTMSKCVDSSGTEGSAFAVGATAVVLQ